MSKGSASSRKDERLPLTRIRVAGLVAALLAALLLAFSGSEKPGRGLFDLYQRASPAKIENSAVQLVLIDDASIRAIGPWPWPRSYLARLTEEIGARGAAAIGFDMVFAEPDRFDPRVFAGLYPELSAPARDEIGALPSMDGALATALGRWPAVLARIGIACAPADDQCGADLATEALPVEAQFTKPLPPATLSFDYAITNIRDLDEVATGLALINGPTDSDGVVRRIPLVGVVQHVKRGDQTAAIAMPGFALELARVARNIPTIEPVISGDRLAAIRLGERTLPVDRNGRMRLHFSKMADRSAISAVDLLNPRTGTASFQGKVVLVGLTGEATADAVSTPLEAQTWGVTVQARAVDAILAGNVLDRPIWAVSAEWALGAIFALAIIFFLPRLPRRWGWAIPLGIVLLTLAASWLAFRVGGLLIDPVRPLALGGAAGLAAFAALYAEGASSRRRLREELRREDDERTYAQTIQRGMLPSPGSLAKLHRNADIDAMLEPARRVGGDFYDALRLADGRIAFFIGDVTGKGVPAALFMALSKKAADAVLVHQNADLAAAVDSINAEILRDNSDLMFVTMLIGILDPATGRIDLVNAGHENPVILRADGRVEEIRMEGGPPLCVAEGFPYPVEPIQLAPGETIVLVTDGVTEAQDKAGGFFDKAMFHEAIGRLQPDRPVSDACDLLLRRVRDFENGANPSDDVAILALRWRGAEA